MNLLGQCLALTTTCILLVSSRAHNGPFEKLSAVPRGWQKIGKPSGSDRVFFRIALSQPNPGLLDQTLMEVSTPSHLRYGRHLKRSELKDLMRPSQGASASVLRWLSDFGINDSDIHDDGDWINFQTVVSTAESMMDTTFDWYRNRHNGAEGIRTLQYSVPEQVRQHIELVQPTTRFGQVKPQLSHVRERMPIGIAGTGLNVTACNATITPACLKDLYKIGDYKGDPSNGNMLAFNNFLEEYPRYADLARFEEEYAPYAVGSNFTYTSINGGLLDQNSSSDSVEANLDVQYALSISYDTPIMAYTTAGRGPLVPDLDQPTPPGSNEPYLDFLTYVLAQPDDKLPQTLSTSYGEDEQSVPESFNRQVCQMFAQLGTRGVSILFSSGDTGVGSACQTNDGKNTTRFLPIFPAACPYVTSVGGTFNINPERAVSFSSGGFSDRFPRPSYQDAAVSAYLSTLGDKFSGLFNPNGRGFPDVAAQARNFHVIDKGMEILVGGTSAAAPTFSGIVALLNGARISAGKPPLGFLNPFIYSEGYQGLNDITAGGSTGCTGVDATSGLPTPIVPGASWNATEGWDPVTGYGTPDFEKLLDLALKQ